VISGGAGAPLAIRSGQVPWASSVRSFSTVQHYCLVRVNGDEVRLEVYDIAGGLIDVCVLTDFR
jgi:hypothetical protein